MTGQVVIRKARGYAEVVVGVHMTQRVPPDMVVALLP